MNIKTALLALTCLAVSPAWAINKCTGADGSVTYQEAACGSSAKSEAMKVPSGPPPNKWESMVREAMAKARVYCKTDEIPYYPEIGWTEEKFLRCTRIGVVGASKVNITENDGGISKQYVFRLVDSYIYTRNGVVTSIQKSR